MNEFELCNLINLLQAPKLVPKNCERFERFARNNLNAFNKTKTLLRYSTVIQDLHVMIQVTEFTSTILTQDYICIPPLCVDLFQTIPLVCNLERLYVLFYD